MMRPIDADALKFRDVRVTTNEIDFFGFGGYFIKECKGILQEEIWDAPTIDVAPHWIPCEERLPEYFEPVITWDGHCYSVEHRIPYIRDEYGDLIKSEWWVSDDYDEEETDYYPNLRDGAAIAWMPLPKPYEGERKDDEC